MIGVGRWLVAAAAVVSVAGCGGGTTLAGDGVPDGTEDRAAADDGGRADIGDAGDATDIIDAIDIPDTTCGTRYHWELQPRTIAEVQEINVIPERLFATDRLWLQVQMTSECERLGRVTVEIMPGDATDFVTLRAWAWAPVGLDCPPSAPLVPWIVEIPGRGQDNLRAVVTDGHSPGGGLRLTIEREIACSGVPECLCVPGTPAGAGVTWDRCLTDCSCGEGLSCIGSWTMAGPEWNCLPPCNDLLDCGPYEICQEPEPDGVPWVCDGPVNQCTADEDCPAGFACLTDTMDAPNWCEDRRAPPANVPCGCDEQCPAGQRCVVTLRAEPTCEIPCLRDADCPDRGAGAWVCGTASICVPLE